MALCKSELLAYVFELGNDDLWHGSFGFCADGLELDGTGERVGADVVILVTGFDDERLLSGVFVSPWFREIIVPRPSDTMLPLYRSVGRLSLKLHAHLAAGVLTMHGRASSSLRQALRAPSHTADGGGL